MWLHRIIRREILTGLKVSPAGWRLPNVPQITFCLILTALLLSGCGRKSAKDDVNGSPSTDSAAMPNIPAADYLRHVLGRYGTTTNYQDQGEVRLSVEVDGAVQRFTAPMHVLLDGPIIWVAAYDGRIWSDSRRTVGWVHNEKTQHHDSQVVVGATASPDGRPDLKRLLNEPTIREKIVAGLGGPPPQLEWLLEPDPMAKLFDGKQADIQYGGIQSRDNADHVVVDAVADGERYRFWIDGNASLIRNVELPISLAEESQHTPEGWRVRSLELRLPNATFAPTGPPPKLAEMRFADVPTQPKYVRAMVPLPPSAPHRMLGRWLEPFEATDVTNRWSISERGAGNDFTLFANVSSDERGAALLQSVSLVQAQVPPTLRDRLATVVLVDGKTMPQFDPSRFLVVQNGQARVSQRMGLDTGAACLIDREGRVLWFADSPQWIDPASVVSVLTDSASGVDVPARISSAWQANQNAYRQKLAELRVDAP